MDAEPRADDPAHEVTGATPGGPWVVGDGRTYATFFDAAAPAPTPPDPVLVAAARGAAESLQSVLQAADRDAGALAAAISALRASGADDDAIAGAVGLERELVTAAGSGQAVLASILARLVEPPRGGRRRAAESREPH